MTETAEHLEGLHLSALNRGSVIDLETKSRHYRMEYLGEDQVRVSGHPKWCPTPIVAQFQGSVRGSGTFQEDFVGRGMHLVFRRCDRIPVTTSEVTDIRVTRAPLLTEMIEGCRRWLRGHHQ
jgi:hypothetical protein